MKFDNQTLLLIAVKQCLRICFLFFFCVKQLATQTLFLKADATNRGLLEKDIKVTLYFRLPYDFQYTLLKTLKICVPRLKIQQK